MEKQKMNSGKFIKKLENMFKNKNILITGGTGTIGSGITEKIFRYKPNVVRIFSNDENAMFQMIRKYDTFKNIRFLIGDIRDKNRLSLAMNDIDIVYHCASLKHVPLCEYNPFEAIKTNVLGTQNLLETASYNDVSKVINISTDKAVNPITTMGATKLLTERLVMDANRLSTHTIYSNVRFGNVRLSRGSVIPIFKEQIKKGDPITITDFRMTRYMMSINDAIELIFKATELSKGGEIFVFKMKEYRILDIAKELIGNKHLHIKEIGSRKNEKLHEELLTEYEKNTSRIYDKLIIINPQGEYDLRSMKK